MRLWPVLLLLAPMAAGLPADGPTDVAASTGGAEASTDILGGVADGAPGAGLDLPPWPHHADEQPEGPTAREGAAYRPPSLQRLAGPMLQGLERAGAAPMGLSAAFSAHPEGESMHWRWSRVLGDVDGDGIADLVRNDVDLVTGAVDVHALSGADGSPLWTFDNGIAVILQPRGGDPVADSHGLGQRLPDVDGDGLPDVFILEIDATATLATDVAEAWAYPWSVHAVNGRSGQAIWSHEGAAQLVVEELDPYVLLLLQDLPTGWLVEPERIILKTTEVTYVNVYDPTCMLGCLIGWYAQDVRVSDTVTMLDHGGTTIWTRTLAASEDPEHTRWRWLAGTVGDDVVVDVLLLSRPQYSERFLLDPIYGEQAANYGRGMEVRSLDGATGADRWRTTVFDQAAVRANPPLQEEPYPVLEWTYATVLADLDGDGVEDPMASYLVKEASDPSSTNGQWATRFVPLSGSDGTVILRHALQGWGFASHLEEPGRFAVATVDIPTDAVPGGSFPHKAIRLGVVDTEAGPVWNHEAPYAQATALTYELSLTQLRGALTVPDADGDGVRDVLTPAQYRAPTGRNQTLAANAEHHYKILSGADGEAVYEISAWGRMGFAVPCGLDSLVFLSGHGTRIDATNLDVEQGVLWRENLLWDSRTRPAAAPVNIVFWGGMCDHRDDVTALSNNLVTSFVGNTGQTEVEVPSQVAAVQPGGTAWVDPAARGDAPPGSVLFSVRAPVGDPLLSWTNLILLAGSVVGGVGGAGLFAWWRDRGKRGDGGLGKDPLGLMGRRLR